MKTEDEFFDRIRRVGKLVDHLQEFGIDEKLIDEFKRVNFRLTRLSQDIWCDFIVVMSKEMLKRLKTLEDTERTKNGAPVRFQRMLPRSVISAVAWELLDATIKRLDKFPDELRELLTGLLVGGDENSSERLLDTKKTVAALLLAQVPTIGVRSLSRHVEVSPTTILRWKSDAKFQADLKHFQGHMGDEVWEKLMFDAVKGGLQKVSPTFDETD